MTISNLWMPRAATLDDAGLNAYAQCPVNKPRRASFAPDFSLSWRGTIALPAEQSQGSTVADRQDAGGRTVLVLRSRHRTQVRTERR